MRRAVFGFVGVAVWVLLGLAEQASVAAELVIPLNVQPAPAPRPALRYRLLPELREMSPGNPIENYIKCMMQQKEFFFDQEAFQHRDRLLAMPLKEFPAQELREYGGRMLKQADWAARLDAPDWQILLKLRADGIGLLLPEVQQLRSLARALQVRLRAEIAQGRFDDAVRTLETMLAMGQHLGEHPTLIGDLVGIAISAVAIAGLDEMLDQPGCPNLYWALTALPSPLISIEKGMQGEHMMHDWVFREVSNSAAMTKQQIDSFIDDRGKQLELNLGTPEKPTLRAWIDARANDELYLSAARARLVEQGLSEDLLGRFLPKQVILLDERRALEVGFDDLMKTITFPLWQADAYGGRGDTKNPPSLLADLLLPALRNVRLAQARIDQRIALLRHVEALRLYAAEHKGALPAKLSDIREPIPVDPVTGKPFRYEVNGRTAHLRGSPPAGREAEPHFNVHYEVNVQK